MIFISNSLALEAGVSISTVNAKCNTPRRFDIGKVAEPSSVTCDPVASSKTKRLDQHLRPRAVDKGRFPALGQTKAAISRELQRNASLWAGSRHFTPRSLSIPQQRSDPRQEPLSSVRGDRLAEEWTPDQISGWLKSGTNRGCGPWLQTIFAFIYRTAQKAKALWHYLTHHHKRHHPRRARASRDAVKDRASIHDRPKTIEGRGEAGHWEGDLVICKCARPVLVLHSESRGSRSPRGSQENRRRNRVAILAVFGGIDPGLRGRSPSTTTPPSPSTTC